MRIGLLVTYEGEIVEGELEMLARRVLEDAKTTSVAWKAIWKSRETGGDE